MSGRYCAIYNTLMTSILRAFLFLCHYFLAIQARKVDPAYNDKCAIELQEILYEPKPCAFKYLQSLEVRFREEGGLYWIFSAQADSFISTFANTYKIAVHITEPFGRLTIYYPNGIRVAQGDYGVYPDMARSYLNISGFIRQPSNQNFYYTFQLFTQDAQYKAVSFQMAMADDPVFC